MKKRTAKTTGKKAEDARVHGPAKQGRKPGEVPVETGGEKQPTVTQADLPPQVEIVVSPDKMRATIRSISPSGEKAPRLSTEDIDRVLAQNKVITGIKRAVIEQLMAELPGTRKEKKNILIAEGIPPTHGQDAKIVFKTGNNAQNKNLAAASFVKRCQVIAELIPPTEPDPGTDVLGNKIKARNGKPCDIKPGKNVTLSEDKTCFIADMYGIVEAADKTITVKEPLTIGNDKMSADLTICPRLSDNSPLLAEDVHHLLEHAGIVHGISTQAIESALGPDQPVQSIRIAKGTPPEHGRDARIEYYFRLNNLDPEEFDSKRKKEQIEECGIRKEIFSEGEIIAEKIPLVPSVDGRTIFGKPIVANRPKDRHLKVGEGVSLAQNNLQYTVNEGAMGYADIRNDTLFIESPIRISEDRLNVYAHVHAPSQSDRRLTREAIKKALDHLGVKRGIDEDAVRQAQENACSKTDTVYEICIANGKAPENGNDAWFVFSFHREKLAGSFIEDTDRMDFKERSAIQNAKAGDVIARKVLPTSGRDGEDVFGNRLPAEPGRDRDLTPIEGVRVSEDKKTYTAQKDGMISLVGEDRIGIFTEYKIPGDVDYSTGNLDMDGSLIIIGWVREGFSVKAIGDIFIAEGIEDALIRCGANFRVNRGILGKGKSIVFVRGDLISDFIEGAKINAGGSVIVRNSISRSLVTSRGYVDVTSGKGRIIGGTVFALKGVKVNEIGTEMGTETIIKAGAVPKTFKVMSMDMKYLASLRKNSKRIRHTLSNFVRRDQSLSFVQEERMMLEKLKKLKRRTIYLESRVARHKKTLKKELNQDINAAAVDVTQTVHEGSLIIVNGYPLRVTRQLEGKGKFVLNIEKQTVEFIGASPR